MSSSEPEVTPVQKKRSKPSEKSKKQDKTRSQAVVVTEHGKNEGDNPHWAYKPPEGAVIFDHTVEGDDFEWDAIKNDNDLELWLVRVPDTIKAKHLDGLEIDESMSSKTARIGSLPRKSTTFDVWSLGTDVNDEDSEFIGGEELGGISCLIPRRRKQGRLYGAPKPIARRFVITAPPVVPSEHEHITHQNPARPSYPKEILKHRFIPYGAETESTPALPAVDDIEMDDPIPKGESISTRKQESKGKEPKGKKRKTEGETPKKVKKPKVAK
ncbi:hypothetical protein BJ138DRAFT_1165247 [Hygrophoropsis aurantiaca]|uniref:Uncharacterized protein n=1 Tax=Hygrophoropsis aurantiaca TaxID=72124 RepID=A0ACB7ZVW5_9AGAM|nr:hypothetical protein BJ138DRAFT_1165247 [Hygrophoropsis aurantiaca]